MRFSVVLLLLLGCGGSDFTFRPERVDPGRVVHYVKSNLDGSKPALVSLYISGPDTIEVYKSEEGLDDSADVRAHLDWRRFLADYLDAGVITADGHREPRASLTMSETEVVAIIGDVDQTIRVDTFPLHVYNFDLMSLNVMLPHLTNPERSFEIAFAEPTFGRKKEIMELRGTATVRYSRDERADDVPARRYSLAGAGMNGTLWVNKKDGLIEKFESPVANNPGWNSLRLERRGTERMTPEQWQRYKLTHVGTGVAILPAQP